MTLEDLKNVEGDFLTVAEVAKYLQAHPQCVREGLRAGLPWGYVIGERRFVIPKERFIKYHEGKSEMLSSQTA